MADISSIKTPDNAVYDLKAKKIFYAECATARNVVNKVVDCDGFVLEKGAVIAVRFTDTGTMNPTSGTITLNINGTGAKNIGPHNNPSVYSYASGGFFCNNQTVLFVYNGTYYIHINKDTYYMYTPMSLGFGYGTCTTAEASAAKVASLASYNLVKNGIVSVKFTYAVPANATLNVNNRGAKNIFYRGAKITAGIISAGDIATFVYDGTQYQLIAVDSRNAFPVKSITITNKILTNGSTYMFSYDRIESQKFDNRKVLGVKGESENLKLCVPQVFRFTEWQVRFYYYNDVNNTLATDTNVSYTVYYVD